jgi:predicted  nucleic acid-binding Zn-ribbon protein
MPHQCTQCGHTFPDGSKEMLSGCPDCGGNKFQFQPAADARESPSNSSPEPPSAPESTSSTASTLNDESTSTEDSTADARRDVATRDESATELGEREPDSGPPEPDTGPPPESDKNSDMDALRQELNDQFESIKILEPGQYELNLMELYNREEYIIALQEDGQYAIEVPETWLGNSE